MGMTMTQKILAAHAGLDKVEAGEFDEKVAAAVRLYQFGAGDIGGNHPGQLGSFKVDGVKFLTVIVEDQCAGTGADGHTAGDGIDAVFGGDAQRIGHQSAAFHSQLAHIGQVAAADEEGMGRITAVGEVIGRAGNCLLIGAAESFMAAFAGVILPCSVQDKLSSAAVGSSPTTMTRVSRILHSLVSFVLAFISNSSLFLSGILPGCMLS